MSSKTPQFTNPRAIAAAGERFYDAQRLSLEAEHHGEFAAVNVSSGQIYLGKTPEEALSSAKGADIKGLFHLIRVGFTGAFQVSYASQKTDSDWLFR